MSLAFAAKNGLFGTWSSDSNGIAMSPIWRHVTEEGDAVMLRLQPLARHRASTRRSVRSMRADDAPAAARITNDRICAR